jgi:hypothetical protein
MHKCLLKLKVGDTISAELRSSYQVKYVFTRFIYDNSAIRYVVVKQILENNIHSQECLFNEHHFKKFTIIKSK